MFLCSVSVCVCKGTRYIPLFPAVKKSYKEVCANLICGSNKACNIDIKAHVTSNIPRMIVRNLCSYYIEEHFYSQ